MARIAITGASGFLGSALRARLAASGHELMVVSRRQGPSGPWWDPASGQGDVSGLEGADALVHLAGAPISRPFWGRRTKEEIVDSRVRGTRALVALLSPLNSPPRVMVSASATGYYNGLPDDRELTEEDGPGKGFLADLCRRWEEEAAKYESTGARVAMIRTGVVLGRDGGILRYLVPVFKLGLGAVIGDPGAYVSWVHVADWTAAVEHIAVGKDSSGPYNVTAPNPATQGDFARELARALHRPLFLRIPKQLLYPLSRELVEEVLVASQRVVPKRLTESGFRFSYPELRQALSEAVGSPTRH